MQLWPTVRSVLWKFVYGFLAMATAYTQGWLGTNTDPQAWTLVSFVGGGLTAFLAFVKDFAFRVVVPKFFGGTGA